MYYFKRLEFKATDVKYIQLLVANFQTQQLPQTENAKKAVYLDDLERHEFGLVQKQIAHDLAAVSAYRSDSQNVDNLIYHRKLRAQQQSWRDRRDHLVKWMEAVGRFEVCEDAQKAIVAFQRFNEGQAVIQSTDNDRILCITITNWLAPSTSTSLQHEMSSQLQIHNAHAHANNAGVVSPPIWHRKPQQLHSVQHTYLANLGSLLDISVQGSILFKDKADARDNRPMNLPVRLVRSYDSKDWLAVRKGSEFLNNGITETVPQAKSTEMVAFEDLSDSALPNSAWDRDSSVAGAAKFDQLGEAAWMALIKSLVGKLDLDMRWLGIVCDTNPRDGGLMRATLALRANLKFPVRYWGACTNQQHAEWLTACSIEWALANIANGKLTVPGLPSASQVDLKEIAQPVFPQLQVCVRKRDGKHIMVPEHILSKWGMHEKFADQFDSLIQEVTAAEGPADKADDATAPTPLGAPPAPVDEPPAKKARIDMEFIAADQLPGQSITTVPAAGLKKGETGKIHVRSGLRIYFENSSEAALQLKVGYIFGSLGGGQFKHIKREEDGSPGAVDTSKHLLHTLKDHTSFVMHSGSAVRVGTLLDARRATHPAATLCYHRLVGREDKAK